jgi:hypothetical protein
MVKSMLFVLCILLITMNILIFILTFIKSGRNLACTIFAASLYYFTLAAFLWKFLFITNVFQPYWSDRTLLAVYLLIALSLPLCPLLIMFLKYPNSTFISSTCNFCWLTREFLLFGLIIPILVLVCLNFVLYFYTMIYLCVRNRQQASLRSTKSDHSRQIQNFKIALFFATVMGLSWILGFLLLIPNSYVQLFGNILFCIVNTSQGFTFSIMVFCMLERKAFRKCCSCCFLCWNPKNGMDQSTQRSHVPQLSSRSVTDEHEANMKFPQNPNVFVVSAASTGHENNSAHDGLSPQRIRKSPEEREDEHIYSAPVF